MPEQSTAYQVGQEVVLHAQNEKRLGGPTKGTIVKVGRTLVTIRGSYGRESKYGMDDQIIRDNWGHSWFSTLEQEAAKEKRQENLSVLAENGFKLEFYSKPSDEKLALVADLLRSLS